MLLKLAAEINVSRKQSSKSWVSPLWENYNTVCVCLCVCSVTQLCPTLWNPMDCNPSGSSVHGILQARILEWVAMPSSRGSSWPRVWTHISCIGRGFLYHCAILSCSVMSDSLWPHGLYPARLLCWLPCPPPGDLPNPGIEPRCLISIWATYHYRHLNTSKKT